MSERYKLKSEEASATELLRGRVVKRVWRHLPNEVGIEFKDGSRLYVDSSMAIELSITGIEESEDS